MRRIVGAVLVAGGGGGCAAAHAEAAGLELTSADKVDKVDKVAKADKTGNLIVDEREGLWRLYLKGGMVMHAILIASIAGLGFAIERGVVLRQQVQVPVGLVEEAMARMSRGGHGAVAALVKGNDSALAVLLAAAVGKTGEGKQGMLDAVGARAYEVLYELRRNVRPLGIVANVAPMLGLLGTVTGMIAAFDSVSAGGLGRGAELAAGIGEALITTGAGLIVAIPALLGYHYFRGRTEDLLRQAEAQAGTFVDRVTLGGPAIAAAPVQKPAGKA